MTTNAQNTTTQKVIKKDGFTIVVQVRENQFKHVANVNATTQRAGKTLASYDANCALSFVGLFFPFLDSNVKELSDMVVNNSISKAKVKLAEQAGDRLYAAKRVTNVLTPSFAISAR